MPDRPVVLNNTPLVALWTLGRLDFLRELWGDVLIPEAVRSEFLAFDEADRVAALEGATWIHRVQLAEPARALAFVGLDRGEAEVLALAEERKARLVVLDERRGRKYARRLGLALTGTLGVLLLAKEAGLVNRVGKELSKLRQAGLYVEDSLVERVLELAGEPTSHTTQE